MAFLAKFLSFGWHKIGYFLGISVFRLAQKWPFSRNSSPLAGIKMVVSGKFPSSCWQKTAIPGKFLFFGWHKTDRSRGTNPKNPRFFGSQEWIFSGFSFRSFKKMSLISDKLYRVSVVSSRRERFFRRFFRVRSCNSFMCACFLFVCTCARMCAYTRPREIHNVGLFPSVFPLFKKCPHAIGYYSVIYENSSKFPQKSIA